MKENLFKNNKFLASVLVRIIVLVFGLFGNTLVVVAVRKKRSLRTTTNLLLLNLAISDLTTLVFSALAFVPEITPLKKGTFSDCLCIFFVSYNVPLTTSVVSIFTLTVIAVERYHAVVKPLVTTLRLREDTVKYACLGTWLTGTSLILPFYIFGRYNEASENCRHTWSEEQISDDIYKVFLAVFIVLVPFFIISFCYCQILRELYFKNKVGPLNIEAQEENHEKRKLFKITVTVTFVFVLFLFPYAISTGINFRADKNPNTYTIIARIAFFSQSGINPLVYSYQSSNFRQAFKEILLCRG